jgi:hypothetical protein
MFRLVIIPLSIDLSPTKLRIHSFTDKTALKCGSEVWVLKETEEQ